MTWFFHIFLLISVAYTQEIEILGKKLTPLWAQEYIGADLIQEELRELNPQKVNVAIIDLGFEKDHINLTHDIEVPEQRNGHRKVTAHHGTAVVNIFNGPYGITEQMNLISLGRAQFSSSYRFYWDSYLKNKHLPKVISNSVGWKSEEIAEVAHEAYQNNTLWFLASGNDHPKEVRKIERESKAILVGSFAPSGLTTIDTQIDPALLTLAPGNEELLTINGNGEPFLFGATSGATPMVAATVVNLVSILPGLSREQLFTIVKQTHFPSVENKLGELEMPGLFNGYKAFKVVEKLISLCPAQAKTCIDQQLENKSLFKFRPQKNISCATILFKSKERQNEILKEMRKRAFLGNKKQAKSLSCAYRLMGYSKNAEYFTFIASDRLDLKHMEKEAKEGIRLGITPLSYYRYQELYSH